MSLQQNPAPGRHIVAFAGDTIEFTLTLESVAKGRAWLRTNLCNAAIARAEIIRENLGRSKRLGRDWRDIPFPAGDGRIFQLVMPLFEPGHFEAKCFFLPDGSDVPLWPEGQNTAVNVHPAGYCGANTIYNAFVRQFGPNKEKETPLVGIEPGTLDALDDADWTVIPRSGTFRDLIRELDHIVDRLGCRIIQLLPVHPTPTVYGRMGRFGSPYAALDFFDVDPALAEFDEKVTPVEQFIELADAIHARNAKLFLDMAVNHTGWASRLHMEHPEWFKRASDGTIISPGAWGVVWRDLTEMDHAHRELREYVAEMLLTWCRRGVDGFRCDAGYMLPIAAWEHIIACVRKEFPDTVFLLEGLGGKIEVTNELMNICNMNWAYSELFQNITREEVEAHLAHSLAVSAADGLMVHFAETHDNARLAAKSQRHAVMRTALSALCSNAGAFAFANGVEWFATEKLDVHEARALNWNAGENQVSRIARLTRLLREHPAFYYDAQLRLLRQGRGSIIALLRRTQDANRSLLVLVNLDEQKSGPASWKTADFDTAGRAVDLLSGQSVAISTVGDGSACELKPGEALCLGFDPGECERLDDDRLLLSAGRPLLVELQMLRAKALAVFHWYEGLSGLRADDVDRWARELAGNPVEYCARFHTRSAEPMVTTWAWPNDLRRDVMILPNHFLLVTAPHSFVARLAHGKTVLREEASLRRADGSWFALFLPRRDVAVVERLTLSLVVFEPAAAAVAAAAPDARRACHRADGHVLYLPEATNPLVQRSFAPEDFRDTQTLMLATNGRGGMSRAAVVWGRLRSRYNALLAGNLSPEVPEDRRIMLTRFRGWVVFRGYSEELNLDLLDRFTLGPDTSGHWRFHVPFGSNGTIHFEITLSMIADKNAILLSFHRPSSKGESNPLSDGDRIRLVLRPDLEDRPFHETTKAFNGPEAKWPGAVQAFPHGFRFAPDAGHSLLVKVDKGDFTPGVEWQYMVRLPLEEERGLDFCTDLFSPGYFQVPLSGGESAMLSAQILTPFEPDELPFPAIPVQTAPAKKEKPLERGQYSMPLLDVLDMAMRQFVVRRGALKTVIAGYPWFLDWGRDTLICARGLIAGNILDEVRAVLKQFAHFEKDGTLPNMIFGNDAGNRDTSDAPFWFFVACSDLTNALSSTHWLEDDIGGRTVRDALNSLARGVMRGTPNNIRMDPESGLVFSPAHFTWMDTNHPAGTPREGYPIEIQALWHAALSFLARIDNDSLWPATAARVSESMVKRFWVAEKGYCIDCLHAAYETPAARAVPDDALRPNQLLAFTLGAIEDIEIRRRSLETCRELLVPGAIRTLADRPVEYALPVRRDGRLLNDPLRPYWGRYEGDEDTRRKPAYHNGTAWTWMFPSFCEAWFDAFGPESRTSALSLLCSSTETLNTACLGQIPEILDGDRPHTSRGCDAQAWGVTELYRVLKLLQ